MKLSPLKSKSVVKAQPKVNWGDYLYLCDIKEFSDLNLYLDELDEVRAIDAYRNLPKRLVFKYKGGRKIQWPLYRILQESQAVLIKVYSSFKKNFGFNVTARRGLLKRIEELRSFRAKDALPKTLSIPFTGYRVQLRAYWLMNLWMTRVLEDSSDWMTKLVSLAMRLYWKCKKSWIYQMPKNLNSTHNSKIK